MVPDRCRTKQRCHQAGVGRNDRLEEQESAAVQVLARPATSHSRAHLLKAARRLRQSSKIASDNSSWTGGRPGTRGLSDPAVEAHLRMVIEKASSPMFECLIRLSASSPKKEQARGRMHALAGSFAVFEGRNGFRRRALHEPGVAGQGRLKQRFGQRGGQRSEGGERTSSGQLIHG